MKILSHRGFWKEKEEQNSEDSIRKSLKFGFGFESDIRDNGERLVISHNPANTNAMDVSIVLSELKKYSNKYCFAINIKSDGLAGNLKKMLNEYDVENYFAFDMSVPQMLEYRKQGLTYFTRQSEYEVIPALYEDAAGVWIDGFKGDEWITEKLVIEHLKNGKKVCIVSPELHGREPYELWRIMDVLKHERESIYLCTDLPVDASLFFNNKG